MILPLAALALAALAARRGEPARRAGLVIAALLVGLAGAQLSLAYPDLGLATPLAVDADGRTFLQVTAGLLLLALALAWWAAPGLPVLAVTVAVVIAALPLGAATGVLRPVAYAAALLAVGALGGAAIGWLRPGRLLLALDRALLDPSRRAEWRPDGTWRPAPRLVAAVTGATLALFVPHLATVLGGAMLAAWAALAGRPGPGRRPWPLGLVILALGLALLWATRLSGPLGGWIPSLVDGPFSPRAAILLAALVSAAVGLLVGSWPFHGLVPPLLLAPVAVAVGFWFGILLVPDGVAWWHPVLAPLALFGMAWAASWRRIDALLIAAGVFGLWTGQVRGGLGGAVLVLAGWTLAVGRGTRFARLPSFDGLQSVAAAGLAAGGYLVLQGALRADTGYGVLWLLIAAAGLVGWDRARAGEPPGSVAVRG